MCNGMCIGMCNRMCIECAILFVVHIRVSRAFITGHVDSLQALRCISKRRSEQRGYCWSAQDLRDASVLMNMFKSSAVLLMCWRYKQTTTSASTVAGIIDARDDTCPSLPATPKSQRCWSDKLRQSSVSAVITRDEADKLRQTILFHVLSKDEVDKRWQSVLSGVIIKHETD